MVNARPARFGPEKGDVLSFVYGTSYPTFHECSELCVIPGEEVLSEGYPAGDGPGRGLGVVCLEVPCQTLASGDGEVSQQETGLGRTSILEVSKFQRLP